VQAAELLTDWRFWGRPSQQEPAGDWVTWLILAGRGFGKTRTGAEMVRAWASGGTPLGRGRYGRIALVAETAADARDVMVEGESGILAVHPLDFRPLYEPSKRRLTWPNGAVATLYNAVEPDQLRGPQHDAAWCDELAKWRYVQETWDQLQFGLRLGDNPRQVITTTPRPLAVLRQIMSDPRTVTTRGSTYDNRSNLAAAFFDSVITRYEGTRLGRQELAAEILDDMPGALWRRARIDELRKGEDDVPTLRRVIVAIDPAASTGEGAGETGIIGTGLGDDRQGYVLEDASCSEGPDGWARRAVALFDRLDADAIVAEVNQGGDMVESVIRSVRPTVPVIKVRATRGKAVRAEPISALYEQGRVHHVGSLPALEDQMCQFDPVTGLAGGVSPDRVDALVWGLTELFPQLVTRPKTVPPAARAQTAYRHFR
jgi:phage terminase large subunit-like protein